MQTKKKEEKIVFYRTEKDILSAIKIARISGSGLRKSTAENKGSYPIEFKRDGTKTVIRYIVSKYFSENIKTGKAIPAIDFLKSFSEERSGSKAIVLTKKVSEVIGKPYGNLNRLYTEFKGKIEKGLIVSYNPKIEKERILDYLNI